MSNVVRSVSGDVLRDLLLDREDVLHLAVVARRPEAVAGADVGELHRDPEAVARLADAAFQDRAHVQQLGADPAHVHRPVLVLEGGGARSHPQAPPGGSGS